MFLAVFFLVVFFGLIIAGIVCTALLFQCEIKPVPLDPLRDHSSGLRFAPEFLQQIADRIEQRHQCWVSTFEIELVLQQLGEMECILVCEDPDFYSHEHPTLAV